MLTQTSETFKVFSLSGVEKFAIGVVLALAVAGLLFMGTVGACMLGYSKSCVIDFKPVGNDDIQCQKIEQPPKPAAKAKPAKIIL